MKSETTTKFQLSYIKKYVIFGEISISKAPEKWWAENI